jgi:hypothetical protein
MKKLRKLIAHLLVSLFIAVIDRSFAGAIGGPLSGMNLSLLVIIWTIMLFGLESGLLRALSLGLFSGLYSFMPFGVVLAGLIISTFIAHFLFVSFFTNRSLYALVAVLACAIAVFEMTQFPFYGYDLLEKAGALDKFWYFFKFLGTPLAVNLVIAAVSFQLFNFLSVRYKPILAAERRYLR